MNLLLPFLFVCIAIVTAILTYIGYCLATAKPATETPLTPLAQAVFDGDLERVEALLNMGADPNSTLNISYRIEREGAVTSSFEVPIIGGARQEPGMPVLSYAAMQGSTEIVRLLLSKGANANSVDTYGQTPLILAAWYGDIDCVNLLLNRNADIAVADNTERTALDWARLEGHAEVEALLMSR